MAPEEANGNGVRITNKDLFVQMQEVRRDSEKARFDVTKTLAKTEALVTNLNTQMKLMWALVLLMLSSIIGVTAARLIIK